MTYMWYLCSHHGSRGPLGTSQHNTGIVLSSHRRVLKPLLFPGIFSAWTWCPDVLKGNRSGRLG